MTGKKNQSVPFTSLGHSLGALETTIVLTDDGAMEETGPANRPTANDRGEEAIRTLAYHRWEAAGCPDGDDLKFWLEAEQELTAEQPSPGPVGE